MEDFELLRGYKDGSNISLLNVIYNYPEKNENGKWSKHDNASFIFYDFNDDKIKKKEIENVPYEFFVLKDNVKVPERQQFFMSKNDGEFVICPYRQLNKKVAELTEQEDIFKANIQNGNARDNSRLHYYPKVLSSDMHVEDKLRHMFDKRYLNEPLPRITKAFFDIEYDGINYKGLEGTIDKEGTSPINAISMINEVDKRIYVFLLRNKENPLIDEFEKYANTENIHTDLREFIKENVGGWKQEIRYGLDKYTYKFNFYDDEINLIQDLFVVMNWFKPNFVLAWNMAFDMTYIIQRIERLGYDPKDIICHQDFKYKTCKYIVDDGKDGEQKKIEERGDFAKISSYSVFLDQMVQFASRRKGQSNFIRYKLDYIGEAVCNVRKLDYSHITTRIAELPYKDYKTFVFYNIMDTIVQYCIERKTSDIDYVYNKSLMNNVRYSKVHRQTTYQSDRMAKEFLTYDEGLVLGNNTNASNPKPTEKYPGATVAAPYKLNDYCKQKINGRPVNIIHNGVDYDYSAQYPNEARENNMGPHTEIAEIIIKQVMFANENPFKNKYYKRGGSFLEDYMTRSILQLSNRWYCLASYGDLISDVIEYVNNKNLMYNPNPFTGNMMNIMRRSNSDNLRQIMTREPIDTKLTIMIRNNIPNYSLADNINVDDYVYNNDRRYVKKSNADKNAMVEIKYEEDDD